jgi:hypothetical protein
VQPVCVAAAVSHEKHRLNKKAWACNDLVMIYALLMKQGATPFIKKKFI